MFTLTSLKRRLPRSLTAFAPWALLLVPLGLSAAAAFAVVREILPPSWYPGISDLNQAGTLVDEDNVAEKDGAQTFSDDTKSYDVIICGGGTAGCVLASRLSEDPSISVLLLEAGRAGTLQLFSRIPATFARLFRHPSAEWGYEYEPTASVKGRALYTPRARMLGGCSSINAMMCHLCSPSDFDEIPAELGSNFSSYSYERILPYFTKSQSHQPASAWPHAPHPARGKTGPVRIGYSWINELCASFVDACASLGVKKRMDLNVDEDGQGTLGVSRTTTFIHEGSRVTSATSYLTPDVIKRPNLMITVNATCTRVLFSSDAEPRAIGVEFTPLEEPWPTLTGTPASRPVYRALARKEVVLTAGTMGTPHLLKVSGVGPRDELEQAGVKNVVVDLPGVGTGLKEHLACGMAYVAKNGTSLQYLAHPTKGLPALLTWLRSKTGPLTTNVSESLAFVRSTDPELAKTSGLPAAEVEDLGSMGKGPDIEIINAALLFGKHGTVPPPSVPGVEDYYSIAPLLLRPKSTGTIKIVSKDIAVKPKIDAQFLTHEHDVKLLMWGLRFCAKIAAAEPLASKLIEPYRTTDTRLASYPDPLNASDEVLAEWVRQHAEVLYHPVSTCRMGLDREKGGCLDEKLRVHGVKGLRVCDAPMFPFQLSGHPMAPIIAFAEKLSDEMKKELKV